MTPMSMEITQELCDALTQLCRTTGMPPQAAMLYAVRLVNACYREGLLGDAPVVLDPPEPTRERERGRVLPFPGKR